MPPNNNNNKNNNNNNKWTTIRTTLPNPLPPTPSRQPITTQRLLLRPLRQTDLPSLHALQRQPEVMRWTSKGRPDADEAETARKLAEFLPPHDARTFNWAICLREGEGEGSGEGELIGIGGVHAFGVVDDGDGGGDGGGDDEFGWPEVGYLFRREYWGMGLGTEFLRGFLGAWEDRMLCREVVERRVRVGSFVSVGGGDEHGSPVLAREQIVAIVDRNNGASRRVLEKCGFESFADFDEEDPCDPEKVIELVAYRYFPRDNNSLEPGRHPRGDVARGGGHDAVAISAGVGVGRVAEIAHVFVDGGRVGRAYGAGADPHRDGDFFVQVVGGLDGDVDVLAVCLVKGGAVELLRHWCLRLILWFAALCLILKAGNFITSIRLELQANVPETL
ncbi:hypothetical protein VMCG_05446 [Cytospora schulzeri]|uniref:N-acetyltransferase domain-containing protein n=1 Tax=Cytospora schulzeri TaxID=448051 RepID=A0A423WK11_9PEZI|nr:hypothetical protein VMCG_05446 [Valsa malicola]